jgi:accessory gene regulator protein AgrB
MKVYRFIKQLLVDDIHRDRQTDRIVISCLLLTSIRLSKKLKEAFKITSLSGCLYVPPITFERICRFDYILYGVMPLKGAAML